MHFSKILQEYLAGNCCRKILWEIVAGKSCGKLLQEILVGKARKKEENDQLGNFMYRVRGPPWGWFIKKISKK